MEAANPARIARLPVLVKSRSGYQNLCRLITRMKMRVAKHAPASVSSDEVAEHSEGLVALTGDSEGPLAIALAQKGKIHARAMLEQMMRWWGRENVYVELGRHLVREEEVRNRAAIEIAGELGMPLLATNGVCYAAPLQREILDVFTCIREHKTLYSAGRLLQINSERYLKAPSQMEHIFNDLPEAIRNTQELSSRLDFTLKDLGYEFPQYPVPGGESMNSFLRKRTEEGMRRRYQPVTERVRQQVERELGLIEKLNLAGYFLIVWDIVRFCGEQNILIQGRGSAANSAVCYSLGITAVDPIGMELLFERFLSEERGEWPDIDLDLPSGDQRERAIQYVYERYGKLGAAMTANVITFRGRSAAREVGKAMGFDAESIDKLSKFVGSWEWKAPTDTMNNQFLQAGFDLRHPRIKNILSSACACKTCRGI